MASIRFCFLCLLSSNLCVPTTIAQDSKKLPTEKSAKAKAVAIENKAKAKATREELQFFEAKIRPVLVEHCYECHSAESSPIQGGLTLDSREGIQRGGDSGHAVVPGSVPGSLLIDALSYDGMEMPPSGQLPLPVIQDFKRWIQMGAPDPRDETSVPAKPNVAIQVAKDLWSLKPVAAVDVPQVKSTDWPIDDIDRFILAKLERESMQPAAPADAASLVRRVYMDLIGLPPGPREVETFLREYDTTLSQEELVRSPSEQAYQELVDSLLASPQFGERWGRHWLDVARFAESNGRDRDVVYHEAWRYRQYVIDAFNQDMPYDQFITEQLAGDILGSADEVERDRLMIATGFLAIGPKPLSGNVEGRNMDVVDDQIDVTSRAMMGLTVSCARCHDHKFDPITAKDYYALAGIFRSTETLYGPGIIQGQGKNGPKPYTLNLQQLSSSEPVDERENARRLDELQKEHAAVQAEQRQLKKELDEAILKKDKVSAELDVKRRKVLATQRSLEAEIEKLKGDEPEADFAMAVRDAEKPGDCKLHIRGDVRNLGETVERGFVSSVAMANPPKVNREQSGRLELAAWLTHPDHPLTARVAANRLWMHLMGDGLVGTPDNFGSMGEKPTNPELLDYLAMAFRQSKWSTKALVRKIVTSRTYRQSTLTDPHSAATDVANEWFGRMHVKRVDAESLRDAIMFASGKLNLVPPEKSLVAEMAGGEVGRTINLAPLERTFEHRSVYLPILRTLVPEVLRVFDFAEPSIVVSRRSETNVPVQALFFLNSPFVMEHSQAMAHRLLGSNSTDASRIDEAFLLTLARRPSDAEHHEATDFIERFAESLKPNMSSKLCREQAWAGFCQALFSSAEFRYLR